jgi:dihydroorotate dehydrogenase
MRAVNLSKPVYNISLEEKIENLRMVDREIKRLTKSYVSLKNAVIAEMGKDTEAYNGIGGVIATLTMQNRESFDKELFDSEHPNLYGQYIKKTSYSVLRLK